MHSIAHSMCSILVWFLDGFSLVESCCKLAGHWLIVVEVSISLFVGCNQLVKGLSRLNHCFDHDCTRVERRHI